MSTQEQFPQSAARNTFSTTDLYRRADLLQRFLEHIFFSSEANDGDRVRRFRAFYSDANDELRHDIEAIAQWGDEVFNSFTIKNVYERIEALKNIVKDFPSLTLYVPVPLTSVQLEPIGVWCRGHILSGLMLDIKIDPTVVGGCALVYNNTYHDISFSYFVEKERQALVKLVHDYGE